MAATELREITRSISSEMGGVVGNIRKTAADHQKMFSSILKDMGAHFASQSKGMEDVSSSVEQSSSKVASKVDSTNNLLQEQIGMLSNVYAELRSLNGNIRTLNSNATTNNSSLLSGILGGFRGLQNVIVGGLATVGGGAAMLGGGAIGSMVFGGGEGGTAGGGGQKISNPVMAKDIYSYLKEKGVDHEHAVGILANIQNESKFNSGALGDYQNGVATSGGLFQHHNERFASMKQSAGPEWQKNWKGQVDYALSEGDMKSYLKRPVRSGEEAARAFVYDFERPLDKEGEATKRASNVSNVEKLVAGSATSSQSASTTTPNNKTSDATPASKPEPMAPGAAEHAEGSQEGHGGHEGIISGNTKNKPADAGRVIQSQTGIRNMPVNDKLIGVLEKAAAEAGVAVNITSGAQPNFPQGPRTGSTRHDIGVGAADLDLMQNGRVLSDNNPEDVKIKKKFVEAAASAGATGIGAGEGYMGPTKIHVGFGNPATWGGAGWLSGLNLKGGATSPEGERSNGATPYSGGSAVTPGMAGSTTDDRLSQINQNIQRLGGGVPGEFKSETPNMGMGIPAHGLAAPLNIDEFKKVAISNLQQMQSNITTPNLATPAAMVIGSETSKSTQSIQQAQLENQVEDYSYRENMRAYTEQTKKVTTDIAASEKTSGTPVIYDYNNASDISWPDWASMVGGNHWEELKKIKLNMFG